MKHPGIIATACAAINCDIKKDKHSARFFPFPCELNRCKLWLLKCRRLDLFGCEPDVISSKYYICEKHFNPEDKEFVHGKCFLKENAVPVLFDFPCIEYQTTLMPDSMSSGSVSEDIGNICNGIKFTSVTRVVILPDKKIFICGGPLLYPGHLKWNSVIKMFVFDKESKECPPSRGPIIIGIIDTSNKPTGQIVSYELFNIFSIFVKPVVESHNTVSMTRGVCEKIKLRLTKKDHLPDHISLKFLDEEHCKAIRNDPIPTKSCDDDEVDKFFAMVPVAPPLPSLKAAGFERKKPNILRSRKRFDDLIPVYEKRLESSIKPLSKPIILTAKKPVVKLERISIPERKQVPELAEDLNDALDEADNNPLKLLISAAHSLRQDTYDNIPMETVIHNVPIRSDDISTDSVEIKQEDMDSNEYSIYDSATLEEMATVEVPVSGSIDIPDPISHVKQRPLASTLVEEKSTRGSEIPSVNVNNIKISSMPRILLRKNKESSNKAKIINPSEGEPEQLDVPVSEPPKKINVPSDINLPNKVKKMIENVSKSSKVSVLIVKDPNMLEKLKSGKIKAKPEFKKLLSSISGNLVNVSTNNIVMQSGKHATSIQLKESSKGNPTVVQSESPSNLSGSPHKSVHFSMDTLSELKTYRKNNLKNIGSNSSVNQCGDNSKLPDESVNNLIKLSSTVNQLDEDMHSLETPPKSSVASNNDNVSGEDVPSERLDSNDDVVCLGEYVKEDEGDVVCLGEKEESAASKKDPRYKRVITTEGIVTIDTHNIDVSREDLAVTDVETENQESTSALLQEIQKMTVTQELKDKIKIALKNKPNLLGRSVKATRKLIKIPVNDPKQLSKKYISNVLSKVITPHSKNSPPFIVSNIINQEDGEKDILDSIDRINTFKVNNSADTIPGEVEVCSDMLPVSEVLSTSNENLSPVPEAVPESVNLNSMSECAESVTVSEKNNSDVQNSDEGTMVMNALLTGNSVLIDSNPISSQPGEQFNRCKRTLQQVLAEAKHEMETRKRLPKPKLKLRVSTEITSEVKIPAYVKDLIDSVAFGKKVTVIREKITKPITVDSELQPSEVIIGDGLSVKLALCSLKSDELPDEVKNSMKGKKIKELILMKECRKDSEVSEIIHLVKADSEINLAPCTSENTHTISVHNCNDKDDSESDNDLDPPNFPINDYPDDHDYSADPVNTAENDGSIHPENSTEPVNTKGNSNSTLFHNNNETIPQNTLTPLKGKLTEVPLNNSDLPESIKNLMKTAPPSGVKILMVNDPSLLKGQMTDGGFELSSELRDAIKSAAPNSGKVVILKGKNLKDLDLSKVLQQQDIGSTKQNKNTTKRKKSHSGGAVPFIKAVLPQTPKPTTIGLPSVDPLFLSMDKPVTCFCLGQPLPVFRHISEKQLDKIPAQYKELSQNIIALRKELAVAKKKMLRYGKIVKKIKESPPKIKIEHLLEKLKTLLNDKAYELVAGTILNQAKQNKGHRFSEAVKRICLDIALMGGWAPLDYLGKIFTMPAQSSIRRFISQELVTPEDLANMPHTDDNQSGDSQGLTHIDEILNKVCNESSAGTLEPTRCIRSFIEHKKWRDPGFRFQDPSNITEEEIAAAKKRLKKRMYNHMLVKSNNTNNSNISSNKKSKKTHLNASKSIKKSPKAKRPLGSPFPSPNPKRKKSNSVGTPSQNLTGSYSKSGKFGKVVRNKAGDFETDEMIEASVEEIRRNTLQEMFGSGSEQPTITWKYKEVPYATNSQSYSGDHQYSEALELDHGSDDSSIDDEDIEAQANLLLQHSRGSATPNYKENPNATPVKAVPAYYNYHFDVVGSNIEL